METEDLFVPVWVKNYSEERRKNWVPSSSDLKLLSLNRLKQQQACEDNRKVAVKDVSWRKKWVAAWMDVVSRKKWVSYTDIIIMVMLVMAAIPHDEDYHDFADQRTLFLGIPNTLNVISTIPLFFVGLAGLILNHCESYFRLWSQGDLYTLFAGVSAAGFGSCYYHLNPENGTLFWHKLPMVTTFTCFEAIFIIESFHDWARTKSLASTSYWLWAAGLYLLARVEEVADKQIYRWTLQIVSGHTLGHLCVSMVHLFLILMLAERTRTIELESLRVKWNLFQLRTLIFTKLNLTHGSSGSSTKSFFHGLLIGAQDDLPLGAHDTGLVLLGLMGGCQNKLPPTQLTDHVVALNQAKISDDQAMLETPIRAWETLSRIHGLWGMDIYKNKVLQFLQSELSDESFLGLWGPPGVGKTRLLSLIAASYADSFRHIVFLDGVSSVIVMQHHLASFLKLDWETMSALEEHCRAKIITDILVQDSFLLLLDNVYDRPYPDLVAVGLPMPLGCHQKVVLASRMKCLGDEDAWRLFKYHAGVEITEADAEIYDYAKQMVRACGGLPRGIRALGKGVAQVTGSGKDLFAWQFAYRQTMGRIRHPEEMPEIAYVLV
uniref:NB-ARC domain-containing protein n=1 Tax=Triticum aestivum TaxID=4565 RepID=A0A3B6H244_WHEAT